MTFLQALAWGLLAAVSAVVYEWLIRTHPGHGFAWYYLRCAIWTQILIALSIYRLQVLSTSLVSAVITFTLSTALVRLLVQLVLLNERVGAGNWIAFGLVVLASLIKAFWR